MVTFGIVFLILYVFFNTENNIVLWIVVSLACTFFIFCVGMAYYFASMGVRLSEIMQNEGKKINIRQQKI